jgi:hypothetical protein
MTASSPVKGVTSPSLGTSSSSMPQAGDPKTMKFFIMPQSLSLCLTGYTWFGQASLRSLSKWSVGGHAWCLLLPAAVTTYTTPEPPAFSSLPPSSLGAVVASLRHCLRLFLPLLAPSSVARRATSDGASLSWLRVTLLLNGAEQSLAASLLAAYRAMTLHNSLVVSMQMLISA